MAAICYNSNTTALSLYKNHAQILIGSKAQIIGVLHFLFKHIKWLTSYHSHIILS